VSILVGLGALVRLALLLRGSGVSGDEAAIGVNGLAIRHGEFPIYFAGQSFMGAAGDAYLAGLAYIVLGVAPVTLELVGVLLSIAWAALVVRLVWEAWGSRAAAYAALWLAVPPDFVLWWAQEARPHYHLPLVLGVLGLLLARRVPGSSPATAARRLLVLGLLMGLAYWTNFLSIVYLPAVLLRLALGRYRPRSFRELALPPLGFALGALPHLLYTWHQNSPIPPFDVGAGVAGVLARLPSLARAWPVLLGVPLELAGPALLLLAAAFTAMYLGLAAVAASPSRGDTRQRRADLAALCCVIAVNLGAVLVSRYGDLLWPRVFYLTPIWTALPGVAAAGLATLPGRRLAPLVATLLIAIHAAGIARGLLRNNPPLPASILVERAPVAVQQGTAAALARDGTVRLYESGHGRRDLTFVSAERVIVSSHYEDALPRHARAVDGAPPATMAWWVDRPSSALEHTLAALGAGFEYRAYPPLGGTYARFTMPPEPLRELDPDTLHATASESPARAAWILDRDAATAWRTVGPMRGEEWVEVDLGGVWSIAMVRWLPRVYEETPAGVAVDVATDRTSWRRVLEVPDYQGPLYWSAGRPMGRVRSGRVELRLPPTQARYLRITQTGTATRWPWTISELFVYVTDGSAPAHPTPWQSGVEIAAALRASGIRRLYADHGWGSAAALADPGLRVLPANLHLDAYGWDGPRAGLVPPVAWEPGAGALLEPVDADGAARVAAALGRPHTRQSLGPLVLLRADPPIPDAGRPLARLDLAVTASVHSERAVLALDGDRQTRWATGRPQTPGDWLRIDLRQMVPVRAVQVFTLTPLDWPRGLALEGSTDGVTWRLLSTRLSTQGDLRWGGIALLRNGVQTVRLDFAPTVLRALRLTLTRGDPVYDWSVHELTVYAD
jgi:hypothetical protein